MGRREDQAFRAQPSERGGAVAYIRDTKAPRISPDAVVALAQAVGLLLPPEDIAPLVAALSDQLASITLLDQLDLTNVNPILEFDPRWPENPA